MWDLPRPGLEPVSPALAGRLSTTAPPGKPTPLFFEWRGYLTFLAFWWSSVHTFYRIITTKAQSLIQWPSHRLATEERSKGRLSSAGVQNYSCPDSSTTLQTMLQGALTIWGGRGLNYLKIPEVKTNNENSLIELEAHLIPTYHIIPIRYWTCFLVLYTVSKLSYIFFVCWIL